MSEGVVHWHFPHNYYKVFVYNQNYSKIQKNAKTIIFLNKLEKMFKKVMLLFSEYLGTQTNTTRDKESSGVGSLEIIQFQKWVIFGQKSTFQPPKLHPIKIIITQQRKVRSFLFKHQNVCYKIRHMQIPRDMNKWQRQSELEKFRDANKLSSQKYVNFGQKHTFLTQKLPPDIKNYKPQHLILFHSPKWL